MGRPFPTSQSKDPPVISTSDIGGLAAMKFVGGWWLMVDGQPAVLTECMCIGWVAVSTAWERDWL